MLLVPNLLFAETSKILTIYTYDSFAAEWGPGPAIKIAFEKDCECNVKFVATSNAATLLAKIQLEGSLSNADIVLGLDQNFIAEASATELFIEHQIKPSLNITWEDNFFTPYDYGFFSFIYDKTKLIKPPKSMAELIERDDIKIIVQDPRTSTPGLGLLLWIKSLYGSDAAKIWKKLNLKILTYTPGWSEAYGMFLKNEADMVLSYTTSPAYHLMYENESKYKSASFSEGHYMQIEVAGILRSSKNYKLAQKFMNFISSKEFQIEIPKKNIMYPIVNIDLPVAYQALTKPTNGLILSSGMVTKFKKDWINEWLNHLQ
jgi:thiamine transport system substrate-binding protein